MADIPFDQQDMPVRLVDINGNELGGSTKPVAIIPYTSADGQPIDLSAIKILDTLGVNKLKVNSDGSLNVNTALPAPAASIPISAIIRGSVSGSTLSDTPWIVPANTTFYLQRFRCGGDGASGDQTRFFLYYNSSGTAIGVSSLLKSLFYYNGFLSDYGADLSETISGDGLKTLVMRRQRANATARELFAIIEGYLTYNTITINETNTATTVTATTLTRTGATWTVNAWAGKYLRVAGGPPLYIASNTATVITITGSIDNVGSTIPYTISTFNP